MKIEGYSGQKMPEVIKLAIARMQTAHFGWTPTMIRGTLEHPYTHFLVGYSAKAKRLDEKPLLSEAQSGCAVASVGPCQPVAYLAYQLLDGEAEILQLYVDPDYRQQGWGRSLMQSLRSMPLVQQIFLEVRASNTPAIRLYTGQGMSLVHRRPAYYQYPVEDALIYRWHKEGV